MRDREGVELPDLRCAHAHAALVIEQATAFFDDLSDWRGWVIKITDANDRSPLILMFPAARRAAAPHDEPSDAFSERGHRSWQAAGHKD